MFHVEQWRCRQVKVNENSKPVIRNKLNVTRGTMAMSAGEINENSKPGIRKN